MEKDFFIEHKLKDNALGDIKIIIGERPYKQKINNINFSVDVSNSKIDFYNKIGNIAFFVTNWIKIQDSLEMIFNLLFGHNNSIAALAKLKSIPICAIEFAEILWERSNTLFINRYVNNEDQNTKVLNFINLISSNNRNVFILFVGEDAIKGFGDMPANVYKAMAIHPSGVNLMENRNISYTNCWFHCNNESLKFKDSKFDLGKFRIFI